MKILFLSQLVPFPVDAGPKVRSYHLLQYLASAGHDVTLAAFRRASDRPDYLTHLEQYCEAIHTVPMKRSLGKDMWHLGFSVLQQRPFLIGRDQVEAMKVLVRSLVTETQFDAIHADQLWMAQYGLGAKEALNRQAKHTSFVLDQHNAVCLIPQRLADVEQGRVKRWVLEREARSMKQYELATCEEFDTVVWVTENDRHVIEGASAAQINSVTIPICVDPAVKSVLDRAPGAHRVTFLGGLHWPPNATGIVWFAQEVWPIVIEQFPNAVLTVVGKEPPRALTEMPIPNLDAAGYVEDPKPLLEETAVFIVPLHAGGGMRVKILDAWSWGLPVVSTTIGAEGIKYQEGGDLLIGDEAQTFAQAVLSLLRQPELGARLSEAGRRKVETVYDWHKTYHAWERVYPVAG